MVFGIPDWEVILGVVDDAEVEVDIPRRTCFYSPAPMIFFILLCACDLSSAARV
jgi:hypothetical protein